MASFASTTIENTYKTLLNFGNEGEPNGTLNSSLSVLTDGAGNRSALAVAAENYGISVTGTLSSNSDIIVDNSNASIRLGSTAPWYIELDGSNFTIDLNGTDEIVVNSSSIVLNENTTINGNLEVTGTVEAVSYNSTSSIRYKTDVTPLTEALDMIKALDGVRFKWFDSGKEDIGLIAEEVNKVLPEVVIKDNQGLPKAVDYGRITCVLIEAVKELAILVNR